jgi:hypothetical protein
MNSKRILGTSFFAAAVLTASLAFGGPHHGGSHFSSMGMRGGQTFSRGGTGTWNGGNWSGRNWNGGNWQGGHWNNWGGNRHHHHHHDNNDFIFIGDFGFPWWGWGWGYPYGYGYGYPYGYGYGYGGYGYGDYGYGNGYGYGYGNGYGHGYGNRSTVVEVQRRLARAGYYHGAIDGVMGPQTRRAIRAYERDRSRSMDGAYGAVDQQLPATNNIG